MRAGPGMCTNAFVTYPDVIITEDPKRGAGLRVKKITMSDGSNAYSKEYEYSSGLLFSPPAFAHDGSGSYVTAMGQGPIYMLSSNSIAPMSTSQGSFVGYSFVNERTKSVEGVSNGRTSYEYYNFTETFTNDRKEPFHSAEYDPWRGKLHQVSIYTAQDKIISQQTFEYDQDASQSSHVYGLSGRMDWKYAKLTCDITTGNSEDAFYRFMLYYELHSSWLKLASETLEEFNIEKGTTMKQVKLFDYNTMNSLPSKITTDRSDGKTSEHTIDYAASTGTELGSDVLRNAHKINAPIRKMEKVTGTVIEKSETNYELSQGHVVVADVFEYPDGSNAGKFQTSVNYDSHGNVIEVLRHTGTEKYIWSYGNTKPVIKAINPNAGFASTAEHTAVLPAGYSSLQNLVASLDNIATDVGQQARWRSYNLALRSRQENSGTLIYTYTYQPLIGVTSETDPNGITKYYEYDGLGRLLWVKDSNGNVIKTYSYHFKQ
jgi:YD repeat-containing protein